MIEHFHEMNEEAKRDVFKDIKLGYAKKVASMELLKLEKYDESKEE